MRGGGIKTSTTTEIQRATLPLGGIALPTSPWVEHPDQLEIAASEVSDASPFRLGNRCTVGRREDQLVARCHRRRAASVRRGDEHEAVAPRKCRSDPSRRARHLLVRPRCRRVNARGTERTT